MTLDLLQSVSEFYSIHSCMNEIKSKRVVMCELGAGYGRLAYVF